MGKTEYYLKWVLRISIGVAAIFDIFIFNWFAIAGGAVVFLITFVLDYINRNRYRISKSLLSIFYIFCIFSLVGGVMFDLYDYISWWDLLMHLFSGALLGIVGNEMLNKILNGKKINPMIRFFFIVGIACIGGIVWEIYEYTIDGMLKLDTQRVVATGVADTMTDLITDFVGGIFAGIYFAIFDRRGI